MSSTNSSSSSINEAETSSATTSTSTSTYLSKNGKLQPWRQIIAGSNYAPPESFRELATEGPHENIRLLAELDAKSR